MEDLELYAFTTEAGELAIQHRELLDEFCRRFPGKKWLLKIVRRSAKRSQPQNRYYWGVVIHSIRMGLLNLGHDLNKDEVHAFLKQKFNAVQVVNGDGVVEDIPSSTATLNKIQFGEYVEKIAQWGSEYLSVSIPAPNEKLTLL